MPYSRRVDSYLQSLGITVGDRVRVIRGREEYHGMLLPRSEFGDSDCIVLKLDNGYNIGMRVDNKVALTRIAESTLGGPEGSADFKRSGKETSGAQIDSSLPTISIIGTGGTILSRVDYKSGAVHAMTTAAEIANAIPELKGVANLRTIQAMQIMSEDFTPELWAKIARQVAEEIRNGSAGVIVAQGTDTLHYTTAALSFMLPSLPVPVAVVGAQRSSDRPSSDAPINLLCASYFTALSDVAECCAVMHADSSDDYCFAHRGTKVRKMHTSARDAFKSINDTPIARIGYPSGAIEITNSHYRKRGAQDLIIDDKFDSRVAIVKTYPGIDASIMDYYIDKGFRGIVIEATGLGHTPTLGASSFLPKLERAQEEGITVVVASQCLYGRVNPNVYRNLREVSKRGAVYLEDMLPEVAYAKLVWVLGHSIESAEIPRMMLTNVAGEINPRTMA